MDLGVTDLGTVNTNCIAVDPDFKAMSMPIVVSSGQGVLKRGSLLQKVPLNSFVGQVNVDPGGIDADDVTIPVESDSGTLVAGSTIRIGDEFITVGAYNSSTHNLTTCVRGVRGSTAAVHADNAAITVIDVGSTAVEEYVLHDGLRDVAGYLEDDTDTTADAKAILKFHDIVKKSQLFAKTGYTIRAGFYPSAHLLIVEEY